VALDDAPQQQVGRLETKELSPKLGSVGLAVDAVWRCLKDESTNLLKSLREDRVAGCRPGFCRFSSRPNAYASALQCVGDLPALPGLSLDRRPLVLGCGLE